MKGNCARFLRCVSAVVIGFTLVTPTAAVADLITLQLPGIVGDVTAVGQVNTIEILSITGNVQEPAAEGAGSRGKGGMPIFSDLVVQKRLDHSSPDLFLALVKGTRFDRADFTFLHSGGGRLIAFFTITLTNAVLTKFATNDSENEVFVGHEQINFSYDTIRLTNLEISPSSGAPKSVCWNLVAGKQC